MKAPDYILEAVMDTLEWAMVYCRNYTLREKPDINQINELMEAIHEVPNIASRWPEGALDEIKLHLGCFDYEKWKDSPNLVSYFENAIERATT